LSVKIASSYPRAKQMMRESSADLIVANIDQADAGRGEALRRLRREARIDTPAIVVSVQFTPQDVQLLEGENVSGLRRSRCSVGGATRGRGREDHQLRRPA